MTKEEAIDIIKCLAWHTRPDEEDVEQAIKALERESKWIPCSERLPEDRELVLLSTVTDNVFEGRFFDDNTDCQWYAFRVDAIVPNHIVTAWMPLPKPYEPQESEDEK